MKETKSPTLEILNKQFGNRQLVPIEEIHRHFYQRISLRTLKNHLARRQIPVSPILFPNGRTTNWLISIEDFAGYLDAFIPGSLRSDFQPRVRCAPAADQ